MHMRALAELPELAVLNLGAMEWEDACFKPGLDWLAVQLPHLRVFNAPSHVLVCLFFLSCRIKFSRASYPASLHLGHCFCPS